MLNQKKLAKVWIDFYGSTFVNIINILTARLFTTVLLFIAFIPVIVKDFCQFLDLFFHILGDNVDIEEGKQAFDLPELVYNLNLLVDLAESEIIQIDGQ